MKKWWLIVSMWALTIVMWFIGDYGAFEYYFTSMAISYPFLLVWKFWRYANSKDNKLFLLERHYEMDKNKITAIIDDDINTTMKMEYFIRAYLIKNNYFLYLSKNQFIYIPIDSFQNKSDLDWFKNEILPQIKK